MKYSVIQTTRFRKEFKKMLKRGVDGAKLFRAVAILASGGTLPPEYRDHPLRNNFEGYRDCHLAPDWILVYTLKEEQLVLVLTRTGTHADLF